MPNDLNLRVFLEWMERLHHCFDGDKIRDANNFEKIDETLTLFIGYIDSENPTPVQDRTDLRQYLVEFQLYINEDPGQPTEPVRIGLDVVQRLIADLPY